MYIEFSFKLEVASIWNIHMEFPMKPIQNTQTHPTSPPFYSLIPLQRNAPQRIAKAT